MQCNIFKRNSVFYLKGFKGLKVRRILDYTRALFTFFFLPRFIKNGFFIR